MENAGIAGHGPIASNPRQHVPAAVLAVLVSLVLHLLVMSACIGFALYFGFFLWALRLAYRLSATRDRFIAVLSTALFAGLAGTAIYWMDDLFYDPITIQDNSPYGAPSVRSWAMGLTFALPIFNRNQGNIARAESNIGQSKLELSSLERRSEGTRLNSSHRT